MSGERVMVLRDDPRFDEWPSRKPSSKKQLENRVEAISQGYLPPKVAEAVAAGSAPALIRQGKRVAGSAGRIVKGSAQFVRATARMPLRDVAATAKAGGALGVLGGATATGLAIVTAFAAGYFGTKAVQALWRRYGSTEGRLAAAAEKYREARRAFEAQVGRPITPAENKVLGREFNEFFNRVKKGK